MKERERETGRKTSIYTRKRDKECERAFDLEPLSLSRSLGLFLARSVICTARESEKRPSRDWTARAGGGEGEAEFSLLGTATRRVREKRRARKAGQRKVVPPLSGAREGCYRRISEREREGEL